jgi:hypothetical protein
MSATFCVQTASMLSNVGSITSSPTTFSITDAGLYRLSVYVENPHVSGGFTLTPVFLWTDGIGSESNIDNGIQLGSGIEGSQTYPSFLIHAAASSSVAINTVASDAVTSYDMYFVLEKLG